MANEVTINIESSLAAMAFVVADQQQQLKEMREALADAHKANMDYHKMLTDANCKVETLNAQMLANQSEAKKTIDELTDKLINANDDFSGMVFQRDKLTEELEKLKHATIKDIDWIPWTSDTNSMTIPYMDMSKAPCFPIVAVLCELKVCQNLPKSPNGETYDINEPWIEFVFLGINDEKKRDVCECLWRLLHSSILRINLSAYTDV